MTTVALRSTDNPLVRRNEKNGMAYNERPCAYCGETAWMKKTQRYCSHSCAALSCDHDQHEANGPRWIGDDVGYRGMHDRVQKARGSTTSCINDCVHLRYEWAHIHGTDPLNVDNYQQMCKPCHARYDHSGENNPNARLTWEHVDEIRALSYFDVANIRLAKMYGTSQPNIKRIVRCKTWIPKTYRRRTTSRSRLADAFWRRPSNYYESRK